MKVVARSGPQRSALGFGMCNIPKVPEKQQIKGRQHLHGMCVREQPNLRLLAGKGAESTSSMGWEFIPQHKG